MSVLISAFAEILSAMKLLLFKKLVGQARRMVNS